VGDHKVLDGREIRPTEVLRGAVKVWSESDQAERGPSYWGPYPIRGAALGFTKNKAATSGPASISYGARFVDVIISYRWLVARICYSH
jgi:hypothetical protein